jgi:hypothetical protein
MRALPRRTLQGKGSAVDRAGVVGISVVDWIVDVKGGDHTDYISPTNNTVVITVVVPVLRERCSCKNEQR